MALNFPNDPQVDDVYQSGGITWQYTGTAWSVVSADASLTIPNTFGKVAVEGQNTITSDSSGDTLNIAGGNNVTVTTNASTNTVIVAADGGAQAQNLFATFTADTGSTTADSQSDTLNVLGGTGITTDINGDNLVITATGGGGGGASNFSDLNESNTSTITFDKIAYPAITRLLVDNISALSYTFDQYSGSNPTIYAINGTTIAFDLDEVGGHPFLIQNSGGSNFNDGLIHVSSTGTVTTGASAQGKDSGTLYWKIPISASGNFRYQCSIHPVMVGTIVVKNFVSL